ncbi:MAG TPA: primosomal protein N' [Ferruginibacter sp.]|nr:primosomal protein N' [Ferruginibacter sp.]HRO07003.1 primosomal protein N' [Ferruginibacter sp.]HRO95786.1 primosomal protein N' [Ferruginibacter sp.]HRP49205.1 primosomal protein N' [Ferruginibacter sp.]
MQVNDTIFYNTPTVWVDVILPLALPQVYTYHVPPELESSVQPGCRVEVIFGKSKRYAGIIRSVLRTTPSYPTKPILQVLDDTPLVFENQLKLWKWISGYYLCTEGEVMSAALPANFKLSSETILLFNEEAGDDFLDLDEREYIVADALSIRKQLTMREVQELLDIHHVYPVVKKLIDRKVCVIWEKMMEKVKARREKFVLLNPEYRDESKLEDVLNHWKGAPKQMELLLAFLHLEKTEGDVIQAKLLQKSGASKAQLNALEQKKILQVEERAVDRIQLLPKYINSNFTLSDAQLQAMNQVKESFSSRPVCLLHGVTGSGKTLVYVKLMEEALQAGKQVIYLIPEIALTAQLIRRLQVYFGGYISVYHSRFNDQERVELWNKVRSGETRILLGARSALLLPFVNPGLIIVDEEHDASYKQQDPAPRYHARDAAIYYGTLTGANVLLGSATPSLESYYNAINGKYGLVTLKDRFGEMDMPEVEVVNLAAEGAKGKVMVSERMKESIAEALAAHRQVILFQNRRGYHPYMLCATCGYIPKCSHCDVSLTLHKYSNKLHCHYCGSTYPSLTSCVACGSQTWVERNFGTEKVEETIEQLFPEAKTGRMDMDSVRGKTAHDHLVKLFEQHKLDILVGTQMVVKGLDFEHVGLVGILDADGLLNFADFRVNERAFQLMEQVSGRAGRKHEVGKVLIQAIQVKHPILLFVQAHDYEAMYESEMENRKTFFYPPFSRMVTLRLKHKTLQKVQDASATLAQYLKKDMTVVGPAAPMVGRVRNQYIMELMIKLPKDAQGGALKQVIRNAIQTLLADKRFSPVQVIVDVDPV